MMMTSDPSPTWRTAPKVATVGFEPKVATIGVQTEMSFDSKLDGLQVPVIVEIVPEYFDTESDVQSSRPELQESSGEDDQGSILVSVYHEEFPRKIGGSKRRDIPSQVPDSAVTEGSVSEATRFLQWGPSSEGSFC